MSENNAPEGIEQTTSEADQVEAAQVEAAPAEATPAEADAAQVEAAPAEALPAEEPVQAPPAVDAPEAAASTPAVEAPAPVEAIAAAPVLTAIETPAVVEAIEAPAVVEAVEAPEPVEPVKAVEAVEPVEPVKAVEAVEAVQPAEAATETPAATTGTPAPAKPGPRPSPAALAGSVRPSPPRPVAAGPATPAPAPAAEPEVPDADRPTDSASFGRVDDEGNVHVALGDGAEHVVGQWAAGTPAEGLDFFVRKFDDLSVEVSLATRRLTEGKASPEQAGAVVKRAFESLESPAMVGDLGSLRARVEALDVLVHDKRAATAEVRTVAKAAALAAREAIVTEAEALAESTQWKATGERFKELLDDWKAAPRADRTGEQALWKRFSHARSQFDKHRRQHFARLDGERSEARQVKDALVAEAEALKSSTDWGTTASAYRDLMARWKAAGRAGKAEEEELWQRFRAAQDEFFAARNAELGKRDAGFAENLTAKEALLAEAEGIDTSDLKGAKGALRSIQERWESIGHVPRGDKERIEGRLRRIEDAVRKGEQDQWKRSNPEAKARATSTVEQFSASLAKLEKEHAKLVAAGDTRKATDLEGRITTTKALLEAAERAAEEFSG